MRYITLHSVAQANVNDAGGYLQLGHDPTFLVIRMLVVFVSEVGLSEH